LEIEVDILQITKADEANGLEWKARAQAKSDAYRWHNGVNWTKWGDGTDGFPLFGNAAGRSGGVFAVTMENGTMVWRPPLPKISEAGCEKYFLRD
jgi:hypothetical protein